MRSYLFVPVYLILAGVIAVAGHYWGIGPDDARPSSKIIIPMAKTPKGDSRAPASNPVPHETSGPYRLEETSSEKPKKIKNPLVIEEINEAAP